MSTEMCKVRLSRPLPGLSPAAIQATLLDEGQYLCSTRTMYRWLKAYCVGPEDARSGDNYFSPRR